MNRYYIRTSTTKDTKDTKVNTGFPFVSIVSLVVKRC
jgi:hypothetical protein